MPKKCKGKRNALVVTVVAVLLGDIFAGGQNIPAQQKTWNAGDTKRTQMTESATQRMDLTDAFAVILQGATKKFIAGYAVDDSFLMWLAARYGDEKVVRIASAVLDGTEDPEVWYDITGSSIHVLWLMYCRDSGFSSTGCKMYTGKRPERMERSCSALRVTSILPTTGIRWSI